MTDCPDWQEQVVAPGGGPIGGGLTVLASKALPGSTGFSGTGTITLTTVTLTNAAVGWVRAAFWLPMIYSTPSAESNGVIVYLGGAVLFSPPPLYPGPQYTDNPGCAVTTKVVDAYWDGPVYLSTPNAVVDLYLGYQAIGAGSTYGTGGTKLAMLLIYTD